jgi:hypothetical protein
MRTAILVFLAVALFGAAFHFQHRLATVTGVAWKQESLTFLPGSDRIKPFLLGYEATVAHYLWIRTILYVGGHLITDKQYPQLVNMIDIITRLNPYFYPAYEFAGLMVPDMCGNPAAARIILDRGMTYLGDRKWNVPFYLGMIYFENYGDKKTAAMYFAHAARVPGAPVVNLGGLASTLYRQSGNADEAGVLLRFLYETSESPDVKRHLLEKLQAVH